MTRVVWHTRLAILSVATLGATSPTAAFAASAETPAPVAASAVTEAQETAADTDAEPHKQSGPWHGSTLLFDQSATSQTLGIGGDYQSANPTYEWWVAVKPRLFVYETKTAAIALNLWANLYLELTNSDTTTRRREPLVGPTYLWATFTRTLNHRGGWRTEIFAGPRAVLPTDKAARAAGQYMAAGATAGLSQSVPLRGRGARLFRGARLGINAIYNHPFSRATTGVNDQLRWTRQDIAGRPILSDQLTGSLAVAHGLNLAFSGDLQLSPKLTLSLSYVLLNAWTYESRSSDCVVILTGCVQPIEVDHPTTYRVNTWATAAIGYDILDDVSVSLGYYNLASQLGSDGTHRNPLWSPSARFFLSVIGNLDVVYAHLKGKH